MRVAELTPEIVPELRRFTDTIYLSQSTVRRGEDAEQFLNLGEALDAFELDPRPAERRTHFHVPVFLEELGAFGTTRYAVQEALRLQRTPLSDHLEIETYTWDVLPADSRTVTSPTTSPASEFVRSELLG